MFTGLIQGIGTIQEMTRRGASLEMTCRASNELLLDYQLGDSMAINGACLTATKRTATTFTVLIMPETVKRTTFIHLKRGDRVHLERAMKQTQRFEGHFVSGHIDDTTRLLKKRTVDQALVLTFSYPPQLQGQIIAQGSIALQGVSLTVTETTTHSFSVSLIPHTSEHTLLGKLMLGEKVNIETDMIGKYVQATKYQVELEKIKYE